MHTDSAWFRDPSENIGLMVLPAGGAPTFFAPAGRDSHDELRRRREVIRKELLLQHALDAMPALVMVLNDRRQVLAANRTLLDLIRAVEVDCLGRRPGELVGCVHSDAGPDGCGTGMHCAACGAVAAVLECQQAGVRVSREVRLTVNTDSGTEALDFEITATPLEIGTERFTLCVLENIGPKKLLDALSRTFFHDVLNTAGSVRGYADFLSLGAATASEHHDVFDRLTVLADQLIEDIQSHRDLLLAQTGDLAVDLQPVSTAKLLTDVSSQYEKHSVGLERRIELGNYWDGQIITDERLLSRVLGNTVKNALEATESGGTVRIACQDLGERVAFRVWNAAVMPEKVQLQIFQRSFSTKGESGRGIGTHSIKLLTERYLGGEVGFVSREPEGTTFTVTLPKQRTVS